MSIFKNIFGTPNNKGSDIATSILSGVRTSSPKRGTREILAAYSTSPWLRGVVSKVAHSIATTEWRLFAVKGPKDKKFRRHRRAQLAQYKARKAILKKLDASDELNEIEDHPILELLNSGNSLINGLNNNKLNQIYIDLVGESFLLKERDPFGTPVALWPIVPSWVRELPQSIDGSWKLQFNNRVAEFPANDIIWFKDPDPASPYQRGSGTGLALGDEIDTDEFASKFIKDFFFNNARPDILITAEGLGKPELRRLENDWNSKNQGIFRRFRAQFLNKKVDVQTLTQDLKAMKIADLRKLERDIIMQIYGISPEIMGVIENSNRATIDNADYIFARWVLEPRLELLRTVYQEMLVAEFDNRIIIDYTSPIAQDKEHRLAVMKSASWAFNIDEIRDLADTAPKENNIGKVHMVPFNLSPSDLSMDTEPTPPITPETEPVALPDEEDDIKSKQIVESNLLVDKRYVKQFLNTSEIGGLVSAVDTKQFDDAIDSNVPLMIDDFGQEQLSLVDDTLRFNLQSDAVQNFINTDTANRFATKINKTTQNALRVQLTESVARNETIVQLTARIADVFDSAVGFRARTIARTESVRISNFGAIEGMKQGGIEGKQWLSSRDAVVRDSHGIGTGLDGVIVAINSNFKSPITGAEGPHPGSLGVASEDINCRCSVLAQLTLDNKSMTEAQKVAAWKTFESRRIPFERKFVKDIRKAFRQQRANVLAQLSELVENSNA